MNKSRSYNELNPFFSFLKKYLPLEGLMLVLILIGSLCSLATPYVLGRIIDDVIPSANRSILSNLILIIVGLNILRFFSGICSDYLNSWLANHVTTDIKQVLFRNLLTMPYIYFERNKPGEVIQVISQEVDKIQRFLIIGVIRLLSNIFTLLSLAGILCYLNYRLFFIILFILPVIVYINATISKRVRRLVKNTGIKEGELYNFYYERIKNIGLLKLFHTYEHEQRQLLARAENLIRLYLQNIKLTTLGSNGSLFFISLSPLLILLVGGNDVISGVMSVGSLVAFIQYSNRLIAPTSDFLDLYIAYVKAHESAKRILPFLHAGNPAINKGAAEISIEKVRKFTCIDLGFSIDQRKILSDVNMEFIEGHSYCIIGDNGAGKSTLLKLLSKLYTPTSGSVIVNNRFSLEDISENEWCKHITVISQHVHILHESIRDNLLYGNYNATEEDLWNSLEAVNLKAYVQSLSGGLDTLIGDGEKCANPSGGQMQRLALARSFLRRTDIIILDEVTSAIDNYSSKEIMNTILKVFKEKIIIVITHHVTSLVLFDHIFLLENGILSGSGCHTDLVNTNGKYKSLFNQAALTSTIKNSNYVPSEKNTNPL
jgi:ABC-type bacteriocin/lantibiotic exporter with double-glycine peptidase domain